MSINVYFTDLISKEPLASYTYFPYALVPDVGDEVVIGGQLYKVSRRKFLMDNQRNGFYSIEIFMSEFP